MAQRFNLTAQLQLQAPTNTKQVVNQIRGQLKGLTAQVSVQANAKALNQVNAGLQTTSKQAAVASRSIGVLNKNLSEAARRFGVITLATGTMLSFAQAIKRGVKEAIEFERELIKISQVTGKSAKELSDLTNEITRLATGLGVSSSSLLETSRVLAQAGFSAKQTKQALDILAKTTLGPTFDDVTETVEGAIAVLRQFSTEAARSGGEIKFLESTLDSINAVSKSFAVESSDLISVIRRVGGVFASAGGGVNELIALFTSVRATTRESAETIATGLRTIFTRIQRTDTVNQLEGLGIALRDAEGRFVGAYEAVRRLSIGLSALDPRDYRFSEIVESLGGFRQIGKVIPLIQQFTVAQDALNVAQNASGSVAQDAITAQQSLAVQATRVREEFSALLRTLADSETFRSISSAALELASGLIRIGEALEPVLPLLTSFLALKVGQGLAPGLSAIFGGRPRGKAFGGVVHKFARGGYVPGSGNRDTVPAMLQPGEFVIKKSSAEKLGPETLHSMNNNKFEDGGSVREALASSRQSTFSGRDIQLADKNKILGTLKLAEAKADTDTYGAAFLRPSGGVQTLSGQNSASQLLKALQNIKGYQTLKGSKTFGPEVDKIIKSYAAKNKYTLKAGSLNRDVSENLEDTLLNGVVSSIQSGVNILESDLAIRGSAPIAAALKQANIDQTIGNLFESVLNFAGAPYGNERELANAPFDFPSGLGDLASKFGLDAKIKSDAKTTLSDDNIRTFIKKVNNQNILEAEREIDPILTRAAVQLSQYGVRSDSAREYLGLSSKANTQEIEKEAEKRGLVATQGAKGWTFNKKSFGGRIGKYASGGKADTVPSLLTPGEFVVNKNAAQSIGYSNLHKMNQTGVARYNAGGVVGGVQRFANGGTASSVFAGTSTFQTPDYSLVQQAISGNVKAAKDLEAAQKQQVKVAYNLIKAQNPLIPAQQAYTQAQNQVIKQWGTFYKDLQTTSTATKTLSQKLKQALPTFASVGGAVGGAIGGRVQQATGGVEGIKAGAQKLGDIAGAAQQFTFLAGSAAALVSQFSDLDDASAKATTETVGFVTGIVGVGGTVVQLFTSLIGAGTAEAAAKVGNAAATTSNTAASGANTVAVNTNTQAQSAAATAGNKVALGFAAAAAIVVAVSAALKYFAAQTQAQADILNKAAEDQLKAIENGTAAIETFAQTQQQAASKSETSKSFGAASTGALTGGASGAAIGAAVGTIIPGIGTAIGAAIGGAVGAGMGALFAWNAEIERQTDIANRFGQALTDSATNLGTLIAAQRDFETALKDIDLANLQPEERISRRLVAQGQTSSINQQTLSQANSQLQSLAAEIGKPVNQLQEADFKEFPRLATIFKNATATVSRATDGLARDVSESRKTLQDAAKLELTGDIDVATLLADPASRLGEALRQSEAAIIAESRAKIQALQAQYNTRISDEERASITKQINAEQTRTNQRIRDQRNGLVAQNEEIRKNKEAVAQSTAAQEAYRQSLMKINAFTNSIVAANAKLDQFESRLDSASAIAENTAQSFVSRGPAGLDDLSQVGDRGEFEKQVDKIGEKLGPEGQRLAGVVKRTSQLIEDGQRSLIGIQYDPTGDLPTAEETMAMLGLTEADFGPAFKEYRAKFTKAMEDGMISEQEFNDIFGPIIDQGQASADALKQGNDLINRQYEIYGKYIDQLIAVRDKEITTRQSIIDAQIKSADIMAQATGVDQTPAQKEAQRRQRAQVGLQGIVDPRGRQVQAGNVEQIAAAKAAAKAEREKIAQLKESGNVTKQMIERDKELINQIGRLDEELARLSDQSAAVSDLMGQLDRAKEQRETAAGIVEDFVVGGNEERRSINAAFAGIQNAISTGTLQGQSEEQRKLTVEMLDRLGDIQIAGTGGLTAKDIKKELVFRDAVQLGLSPDIARQLATQTTAEERLINSLDRLTNVMEQAAANLSSGGPVRRFNSGGVVPGVGNSDTVPASLTPGEFVLNKSAVNKIGANNLARMNKGGVVYAQEGGIRIPIPLRKRDEDDTFTGLSRLYNERGEEIPFSEFRLKAPSRKATEPLDTDKVLSALSTGLGVAGMTPGFGEPFDLAAAGVDALRGDYTGAAMSLASMIPIGGMAAGAAKLTRRASGGLDISKALAARRKVQKVEFDRGTKLATKSKSADIPVGADVSQITKGKEGLFEPLSNTMLVPSDAGSGFSKLASAQKMRRHESLHAILSNDPSAVNTPLANLTKRLRGSGSSLGDAASVITEEFAAFATDKNPLTRIMNMAATPIAYLDQAINKFKSSRRYKKLVKDFPFLNKPEYKALGGTIFKPKGTDTVPAMLTPGEFVIRKSAVDKVGVDTLSAINNGNTNVVNKSNGGPIYRQTGGVVYAQRGGGPITSATTGFVGQTAGASFMTGDMYRGLIKDFIRSKGVGALIKTLREKGKDDEASAVLKLYRAGKFDFNRLRIGEQTAANLDAFSSNARLFSKADASGFEFATPSGDVTLKEYVGNLSRLTNGLKPIGYTLSDAIEEAYSKTGRSNVLNAVRQGTEKAKSFQKLWSNYLTANPGLADTPIATIQSQLDNENRKAFEQARTLRLEGKFGKEKEDANLPVALKSAIDTLKASGLYFNRGGQVPSYLSSGGQGDTVPAMLTPGEFVINKEAVQKYGLQKMQELNKGNIQGFNKGGLVGGVQYKQDGGTVNAANTTITIDPSRVQGVFDNFLGNFSGVFDNIVSSFSGIQNALTGLVQSMSGFTMQHNVTVEGLISIGGLNLESIKQELSTSIGKMVGAEVERVLTQKEGRFKAG